MNYLLVVQVFVRTPNSYPENWTATADLFDQYKISSVVGKLPAEVLQLIVNKNYHAVRERLFGAIGSVPNQIYLFEDILAGEQSDKFREEYKPYPAHAILEEAGASEADLIALATHGMGGLRRLFLGSVSDKVLRGADISVFLYRPFSNDAEVEAPST